jgi:hypothetical protein
MTIFRPKRGKWQEAGEDCIMRSFNSDTSPNITRVVKSRMIRWAGNAERWER